MSATAISSPPTGLGVKNGHLECVRWMVSETEAIAELSCTREHPSLIHYTACYGQEKVLLWLLQFMQEQAVSLDEVDQNGNTAVRIAAQYGHLSCIQIPAVPHLSCRWPQCVCSQSADFLLQQNSHSM